MTRAEVIIQIEEDVEKKKQELNQASDSDDVMRLRNDLYRLEDELMLAKRS